MAGPPQSNLLSSSPSSSPWWVVVACAGKIGEAEKEEEEDEEGDEVKDEDEDEEEEELGIQSCDDGRGEDGLTTSAQGISHPSISKVRIARMSQAKVAGPPQLRVCQKPELRACSRRRWPDRHSAWHLRGQSCEAVSGERGLTTKPKAYLKP